jgi:hypothetical protein
MTEKSPVDCSSTSTLITTRSGAEPGSLLIFTFLKKLRFLIRRLMSAYDSIGIAQIYCRRAGYLLHA